MLHWLSCRNNSIRSDKGSDERYETLQGSTPARRTACRTGTAQHCYTRAESKSMRVLAERGRSAREGTPSSVQPTSTLAPLRSIPPRQVVLRPCGAKLRGHLTQPGGLHLLNLFPRCRASVASFTFVVRRAHPAPSSGPRVKLKQAQHNFALFPYQTKPLPSSVSSALPSW